MTYKVYLKDGIQVARPKSLVFEGATYVPPTDEIITACGYVIEEREFEEYKPSYNEVVEDYIRNNGYATYGAELAVINNYLENPDNETYKTEYAAYVQVRKAAKEYAKTLM